MSMCLTQPEKFSLVLRSTASVPLFSQLQKPLILLSVMPIPHGNQASDALHKWWWGERAVGNWVDAEGGPRTTAHNRSNTSFDSSSERRIVVLHARTLVYDLVHCHPVSFLRVYYPVLCVGHDALRLNRSHCWLSKCVS